VVAAASVAMAPNDRSVFMQASNGSTIIAAALAKSLPYDVRTDFVAVGPDGIKPMLLMVRPELPTVAHEKPGTLNDGQHGGHPFRRSVDRPAACEVR
jgi:hypothetical protein